MGESYCQGAEWGSLIVKGLCEGVLLSRGCVRESYCEGAVCGNLSSSAHIILNLIE